jgi:DNA sulfur modification protein DndC
MSTIQFFEQEPAQPKQTLQRAIELTIASLQAYRARYDHWAISYSGGKDSTALLTLVDHLIRAGELEAPRSLNISAC